MTRTEFEDLFQDFGAGSMLIYLADGRTGLCSSWSDDGVLVDAHPRENDSEQVRLPWDRIESREGSKALFEAGAVGTGSAALAFGLMIAGMDKE